MKRILLLGSVVTVVLLAQVRMASAQSSCAQTLRTARLTYDQGRLHELPDILSGCIANGFTKQERVEAYKLLVLTYIYLEEPTKADQAMLDLLHTDPYFVINPEADPAEFVSLYRTFRTWPIYRYGIKLGVNATRPHVTRREEALEGNTASYGTGINFMSGVTFEVPLNQKLTLNPELYFQLKSYHYNSSLAINTVDENITEGTESQVWVSLPVSVNYKIEMKKLDPFVGLGVSADYLINSNMTAVRRRTNANSLQEQTLDITSGRNKLNFGIVASGGLRFKLGTGYIVGELRYYFGLTDLNNEDSAYTLNEFLLFDHAYADPGIKLRSLSVTAGYIVNVFNPKKLHRK